MIRTNEHHLKQVIHRVVELSPYAETIAEYETLRLESNMYIVSKCGLFCKVRKVNEDSFRARIYNLTSLEGYPCPSSILYIGKVCGKLGKITLANTDILKLCLVFRFNGDLYAYRSCNMKVN